MKVSNSIFTILLVCFSIVIQAQSYQPCQLLTPADYSEWDSQSDQVPNFSWTAAEGVELAYYVFKLHHSVWDEIIDREVTQVYTVKTQSTEMTWPIAIPFSEQSGTALYLWEVYPVDKRGRIIRNHYDSSNSFSVVNDENVSSLSMVNTKKEMLISPNPE